MRVDPTLWADLLAIQRHPTRPRPVGRAGVQLCRAFIEHRLRKPLPSGAIVDSLLGPVADENPSRNTIND